MMPEIASEKLQDLRTKIQSFIAELTALSTRGEADPALISERITRWEKRASAQLSAIGVSDEADRLKAAHGVMAIGDKDGNIRRRIGAKRAVLISLLEEVNAHPDFWHRKIFESMGIATRIRGHTAESFLGPIFLGHGHSAIWRHVESFLKNDLKLPVEAWESVPRTGHHNVEVLEGLLNTCGFAVIVAAGEDETANGQVRIRQNVVHEVGLFQGKLGFKKVALLLQAGIEDLSNLDGLQAIQFSGDNVQQTFHDLQRTLKREGYLKD